MPPQIAPIFLPNAGYDISKPEEFLLEQYSPLSKNIEFFNERMQGRLGLTKFDTAQLSGPCTFIDQYWKFTSSYDLLFCTTKDIYKYDFNNLRFTFLTPKYSAGKIRVENGVTKIYGGLEVDNCDDATIQWLDGSGGDVTPSRNTTSPKEGTAFVRLTVGAGAGVELLAYHNITSIDLTAYDSMGFWIRSSVNMNSGDLQLVVDNTSACASPLETIDIPALTANTWTWVNLAFVTPANLGAVISIGIKQAVDKGACTIDVDQFVAGDWAGQLGVGDYISIGSTYSTDDTWYEIETVDSDTQITLTAAYAGSSAYQQSYNARLIFQGSNTDVWQGVQFLDDAEGEVWIATNGVDFPVWYNGSGQVQSFTTAQMPTDMTAAKYIAIMANRIVWGWTREGGQNQPIRIRCSDTANFKSYDDLNVWDLEKPTAAYWLKGFYVKGDYLIATKEYGAYVISHVGGDDVFAFDFSGTFAGNFSAYSILPLDTGAYYFGYDNRFRFWNGLRDETPFDAIFDYLITLDPTNSEYIYGYQVEGKKQLRWALPYDSTNGISPMVVYDYGRQVIELWEYMHGSWIRTIGEYLEVQDLYVDDADWAELYVDEEDGFWDDRRFLANSPIILYGTEDGYIMKADIGNDDDGVAYTRKFRTKRLNFGDPTRKKRLWQQQWWFDEKSAGSVTLRMRKDDNGAFVADTKTISLVDAGKDIAKKKVTWNKEAVNYQFEIEASVQFGLLGFLNWWFPKGGVAR